MDKRIRFMKDLTKPMPMAPGSTVRLRQDHDPAWTASLRRREADALLAGGVGLLADYQDRLAARDELGLLIVLQGLDRARTARSST
jgi:hypothetical protein